MIWPGGCGWTRSHFPPGWTSILTSFRTGARRSAELMEQIDGVIVCPVLASTPGHEHGMGTWDIHRENQKTDHPRLLPAFLLKSVPPNYCFKSLCSRCRIRWSNRAWQKKKAGWWSPPLRAPMLAEVTMATSLLKAYRYMIGWAPQFILLYGLDS